MEASALDIVIFAPLAPILGVLLFWFIQLLFIESQKYFLEKIRPKHKPLCRFTNFLGIFFQTICHALGYTVTRSGISDVYLSVDYGKVAPKKEKKGIFEWVSNFFLFIGPFFLPALLLLACLFFLMSNGFDTATPSHLLGLKYTFAGQINTFGTSLYNFANSFFGFLINIDLLHPVHLGFLILLVFLGLGMRPSYIGEQKQDKVDMIYDLKNIWHLITHKPLYILLIVLICYVFYYISFYLDQNWYVALFSIFGWLSIISITALIITHFIILLIKTTDKIEGKIKFLPYITLPVSYVLMRLLFIYIKIEYDLSISLIVMIMSTILVAYSIRKSQTNKFKTEQEMKIFKKKNEEENNE